MAVEERRGNERSAERREQILEAASIVLARVGYENITTRRIAQEAKVNVATLHYHFGTKEGLLAETIRWALYSNEALLREAVEAAPDAEKALRAGFARLWQLAQERPGILRYDLVMRAFRDDEARKEATTMYGVYRRLVAEIVQRHIAAGGTLARGMDAERFASYIVSAVDGILLHHLVTGDAAAAKSSLDMALDHALALLCRSRQSEEAGTGSA